MTGQPKIIIPGAAGLVGQNLIIQLKERGYTNIIAIDKHPTNTRILKELHPEITVIEADLSETGEWESHFADGVFCVMLQSQISSKYPEVFVKNTVVSAQRILESMHQHKVKFLIHISSAVVKSVAEDDYTHNQKKQEELVLASGLDFCILRPTLMFGWFDRKHFGWLSRFMAKVPVFPIPGNGKYVRQPLYVNDFCRIIVHCIENFPSGKIFDITGRERVFYIDIIRQIKKTLGLRTLIMTIPIGFFAFLMRVYGLFSEDPPFIPDQLYALVVNEEFEVIPWWDIFDTPATPFEQAIEEAFLDDKYGRYVLDF